MDVEWRFASAEHLEVFRADPERCEPQYGGYCPWARGLKAFLEERRISSN